MCRSLLAGMLLCLVASGCDRARDPTPAADAAAPAVAGKVELVDGDVRFMDRDRRRRRPATGDAIHEGESIATGAASEVHLRMEDGGYVAVRPSTQLTIVNFRAEGDDDDRSVISLLEGSFRSVTGWIAKSRAQRVTIQTPTATIGIRGTEHEPLVIPEGSKLGEPGTYDRVFAGETEIVSKQGAVRVRPNQAGFVPRRGEQRPRVLERVPEVFRPARHEERFSGLHGRVQQQVDQQRDERRRDIEQRRRLREEAKRAGGPGKDGKDGQDKKRGKADEAPGKADKDERKKQNDQSARKQDSKSDERAAKDKRKDDDKERDKGKDKGVKDAGKERLKEPPARREGKQPAAGAERREKRQPPDERQRKAEERKQDREDKRKSDDRSRNRDEHRKKEERKQDKEEKRKAERPERARKE